MAGAGSASIEVDPQLKPNSLAKSTREASEGKYAAALKTLVTSYQFENNRRYHAYKAKRYVYPNDELEVERLDTLHKLTEVVLGGKLFLAPIKRSSERILDIGTGTGSWAIEMADNFPYSEILGNDLSPIQPQWAPANVHFEVDDVEADWTYPTTFDYIHCRYMANAIKDWPRLLSQCYEFTAANGYTELVDFDFQWRSPDNTLRSNSTLAKVNAGFLKASHVAGFEPSTGPLLEGYLKEAGFKDVKAQKFVVPVGAWALDPHLKTIGTWNHLNLTQGLESLIYRLFTGVLGYSRAECDIICSKVRQELLDSSVHIYFDLYVAHGKKPRSLAK